MPVAVAGPCLVSVKPIARGPFRMWLKLPPFSGVRNEPLLCTGATGRADLLYVRYLDPSHVSVGLDHWGVGGPKSSPIEVSYRSFQVLEISLGSLFSTDEADKVGSKGYSDRLLVRWNGAPLLDGEQAFYPCRPGEIAVAANGVGASTTGPSFTGEIMALHPLEPSLLFSAPAHTAP